MDPHAPTLIRALIQVGEVHLCEVGGVDRDQMEHTHLQEPSGGHAGSGSGHEAGAAPAPSAPGQPAITQGQPEASTPVDASVGAAVTSHG